MSGPTAPGRWLARKSRTFRYAASSRSKVRVSGVVGWPPQSWAAFGPGFAVGREAVEGRVVHPDPDREPVRGEGRRVRRGEVGHLLLRDRQRQPPTERRQQLVGPGVGGDHDVAGAMGLARDVDLDLSADLADGGHRRSVLQRRAPLRGEAEVRGVALERVGQAALRLEHGRRAIVEPPLRPAAHDLIGIEELIRDAFRGQAVRVVGLRDGRIGRPQVQAAGDRHDPLAGLGLHRGPGLVRALRQADVVGPVIREPDDPAVVGRRAVHMSELEALQAQDTGAGVGGSPIGGTGPEGAEAHHDEVPFASHQARW